MQQNQTHENIEAELNASGVDHVVAKLRETLHDFEELERRLQEAEKEFGITSLPSRPLVERMTAVGMSKEAIKQVSETCDTIAKIARGRTDEVPDRIRLELAQPADAQTSIMDLLQAILEVRPR